MARRFVKTFTGSSLYVVITNQTNQFWNGSTMESYNAANWGNYDIPLTEIGATGMFYYDIPSGLAAGDYNDWYYYGPLVDVNDNPYGTPGEFSWSGTTTLSNRNSLLNDDEDSYWIDLQVTHNETSGRDEYAVLFYRNDVPQIASQVTSPQIKVEELDGTGVVPLGALAQVAVKANHYRYVTNGPELLVEGKLYFATCSATINSQSISRLFSITLGSKFD